MKPPSSLVSGADVERALEPGAVPHLDAWLEHDGALAHVEHHARLDRRAEHDDVGRVAQDEAALGHAGRRRRPKVGAVVGEEPLERGDEIERAPEQEPVDLDAPRPHRVGPFHRSPAGTIQPTVAPPMGEPPRRRPVDRQAIAGGREPRARRRSPGRRSAPTGRTGGSSPSRKPST